MHLRSTLSACTNNKTQAKIYGAQGRGNRNTRIITNKYSNLVYYVEHVSTKHIPSTNNHWFHSDMFVDPLQNGFTLPPSCFKKLEFSGVYKPKAYPSTMENLDFKMRQDVVGGVVCVWLLGISQNLWLVKPGEVSQRNHYW